ncbi:hypothetical protein Scep_021364 [Stephania cephalantha]|uniref:Uncharacterized protein n=1 Tax=Stephania cephalantha TaxID=152367 RepID=A0AAP0I1F5_9MAGN
MVSKQSLMVNLSSSSSSIFADVAVVAKSFNFNLPFKLNESNFSYWKVQVRAAVRALGLELLLTTPRSNVLSDVSLISGGSVVPTNNFGGPST